ncbi:hypothetical protein ACH492_38630 [Streptomyces sp. NPDC019443]|uniref:hypothetical protein n=1 Tax=Streptomyces sp. NPDC019443 TaxID=3365061 RepID=UPI0037B95CF8
MAVQFPSTASVGEVAANISPGQWAVIVDEGGRPTGAVLPVTLSGYPQDRPLTSILSELPPTVIAPAEAPVGLLASSWMIEELEPDSPVIVAYPDHLSVWSGPALHRALASLAGEAELYGDEDIDDLAKSCEYREDDSICTHREHFVARPTEMPECPNPECLSDHDFTW